jgi:hypothetical protein
MAIPTLTHSGGDDHLIVYTSSQGTSISIVAAHITDFTPINTRELMVDTVNTSHHLKFASESDRDGAMSIVSESLKTAYIGFTINEKLIEGAFFNANAINLKVAPNDVLDTLIIVPSGIELNLFIAMTHGGDTLSEFFIDTTYSGAGSVQGVLSRNEKKQQSYSSAFTLNPTITDIGTKKGQQFSLGKKETSVSAVQGTAPTFILAAGTYLLRATNVSGYWMPMQRRMQFWESPV